MKVANIVSAHIRGLDKKTSQAILTWHIDVAQVKHPPLVFKQLDLMVCYARQLFRWKIGPDASTSWKLVYTHKGSEKTPQQFIESLTTYEIINELFTKNDDKDNTDLTSAMKSCNSTRTKNVKLVYEEIQKMFNTDADNTKSNIKEPTEPKDLAQSSIDKVDDDDDFDDDDFDDNSTSDRVSSSALSQTSVNGSNNQRKEISSQSLTQEKFIYYAMQLGNVKLYSNK